MSYQIYLSNIFIKYILYVLYCETPITVYSTFKMTDGAKTRNSQNVSVLVKGVKVYLYYSTVYCTCCVLRYCSVHGWGKPNQLAALSRGVRGLLVQRADRPVYWPFDLFLAAVCYHWKYLDLWY